MLAMLLVCLVCLVCLVWLVWVLVLALEQGVFAEEPPGEERALPEEARRRLKKQFF